MLLVEQEGHNRYSGVLETSAGQFWLTLTWLPTKTELYPEWRLEELLRDAQREVARILKSSSEPEQVFAQLETLTERIVSSRALNEGPSSATVQQLLTELQAIGPQHITAISDSFHEVKLEVIDKAGRRHMCTVHLSTGYPQRPPKCTTALPVPFTPTWQQGSGSLAALFKQFEQMVEKLQMYWDTVQELYTCTHVLDPPSFNPSATVFRIGAGGGAASLQVTLAPLRVRMCPHIQLLGPDHETTKIARALAAHAWDESKSMAVNLTTALGDLIRKRTQDTHAQQQQQQDDGSEVEDVSRAECGVCYTYKLDGAFPDQVCPNPPCSRSFHASCLEEWLQALPETRHTFDTLFGACPYCESQITLKIKR